MVETTADNQFLFSSDFFDVDLQPSLHLDDSVELMDSPTLESSNIGVCESLSDESISDDKSLSDDNSFCDEEIFDDNLMSMELPVESFEVLEDIPKTPDSISQSTLSFEDVVGEYRTMSICSVVQDELCQTDNFCHMDKFMPHGQKQYSEIVDRKP